MDKDRLDLYKRASAWMISLVPEATKQLHVPTPCDNWDVEQLMNHMLDTQRYFIGAARGTNDPLPSADPPTLIGDDPCAAFDAARTDLIEAYDAPGVIERTGPSLGIAFSDQLLHGWDLARATAQDPTMPEGLAGEAFDIIHGQFTDEQRKGVFKPEIPVAAAASAQDKLLAFAGRDSAVARRPDTRD